MCWTLYCTYNLIIVLYKHPQRKNQSLSDSYPIISGLLSGTFTCKLDSIGYISDTFIGQVPDRYPIAIRQLSAYPLAERVPFGYFDSGQLPDSYRVAIRLLSDNNREHSHANQVVSDMYPIPSCTYLHIDLQISPYEKQNGQQQSPMIDIHYKM